VSLSVCECVTRSPCLSFSPSVCVCVCVCVCLCTLGRERESERGGGGGKGKERERMFPVLDDNPRNVTGFQETGLGEGSHLETLD